MRTWAIILTVALVWGGALAKTTTWTNGAVNRDFADGNNWDNGVAETGDTIDTLVVAPPNINRPNSGTFHFSVTANTGVHLPSDFLDGADIGDVTLNHAEATITLTGDHASLTVTAGTVYINTNLTNTGGLTIQLGGCVEVDGGHTYAVYDTAATINGQLTLGSSAILDANGVIDGSPTLVALGEGAQIWGGVNFTSATWSTDAQGNNLLCTRAGGLNLGASDANTARLAIAVSANTTLGANLRCGALTATSGTLAAGTVTPYTITGASFTLGGATFSGSGACTVAGDIRMTAGTWSHTGAWTMTADGTINRATGTSLASLTVASGVTASLERSSEYIKAVEGAGNLSGASTTIVMSGVANGFWTLTGTCNVKVLVIGTATTGGAISLTNANLGIGGGNATTITASGPISLGTGTLTLNGTATGPVAATLAMAGHSLTAGAVTLGQGTPYEGRPGALTLGGGVHRLGTLAQAAGSTAPNTLNLGSASIFVTGEGINGSGITVTTGNGARVKRGSQTAAVTNVTATGWRLRTSCAIGAGNTNVAKLASAGGP